MNRFLAFLLERMAEECELERLLRGTVEVDKSYFGPRRVKGKAGRGAGKKTIVFGICKRHGKVTPRLCRLYKTCNIGLDS